jgi:threonine/homoserine/homoserine lactone efflux protein
MTFALASFVLIVVPGPSVMFVISRAVALGRRAAVTTVMGNAIGVYLQVVAVAFGLGAIVARSVWVFQTIKLVGSAYLVYLGVRTIRDRRSAEPVPPRGLGHRPRGSARLVADGVVVGAANPKSIVFFAAFLPQFVDRSAGHVTMQMLVLGVVFAVIALVSDSAWGIAAGSAGSWLKRSPQRLAQVRGAGGLVMIGLGVRLAVTGRTH